MTKEAEKANKLEQNKNSAQEQNISNPISPLKQIFGIIAFCAIIYFILIYLDFQLLLKPIDIIQKLLNSVLKDLGDILRIIALESFTGFVSFYIVLILYLTLILALFARFILSNYQNFIHKWIKWTWMPFIIIVLLCIGITMGQNFFLGSTTGGDDAPAGATIANVKGQTAWEKLKEDWNCLLNPTAVECIEKENQVETEQAKTEIYSITLKTRTDNYYDNIEYLKENGIPITYSIQSTGRGIYLEKLECYQDKISKENLLDTVNIEERAIYNSKTDKTFTCNAGELKLKKKLDDNVVIKTVLYLNIDTTYQIEIPLINYDKYITESDTENQNSISTIKEKLGQKYGKGKIIPSNNALTYDISQSETFPLLLSSDDTITKEKYDISLTLSENSLTEFGILNASSLISITPTKILTTETTLEPPIKLDTYKEKSILRFSLLTSDAQLEETDVYKDDSLFLKINSKFQKTGTQKLIVQDPNFIEEKKTTETTTTTPPDPIKTEQTNTQPNSTSKLINEETNKISDNYIVTG